MTDNHSGTRSRARRSERTQHFYAARSFSDEEIIGGEQPAISQEETEHEIAPTPVSAAAVSEEIYTPNELASPEEAWEGYAPNETPAAGDAPVEAETGGEDGFDFSAYYRRDGKATDGEEAEPAFAPPIKLDFAGYDDQPWNEGPSQQEPQSNVYRPREATWADTARRDILSADGVGYQVWEESEGPAKRRRRRRALRNALITLAALLVLGAAAWVFREPVGEWLGQSGLVPPASEEPFAAVVTPQPIEGYDAAPAVEIADSTRTAISKLSGTVQMRSAPQRIRMCSPAICARTAPMTFTSLPPRKAGCCAISTD